MPESDPSYLEPYRKAVADAGPGFEALLWKSREFQTRRFEIIAETSSLHGRVVCDLGCGRADFALFLHTTNAGVKRYIGIDGIEELVEASRTRTQGENIPNCVFHCHDFVAEVGLFDQLVAHAGVEVFVLSGSLNTLDQPAAERVLDRIWSALTDAGRGELAFNFLSDRHDPRGRSQSTGPANRFDTHRLLGWALDRSPLLRFRHDYLKGHDATIVMQVADPTPGRRA